MSDAIPKTTEESVLENHSLISSDPADSPSHSNEPTDPHLKEIILDVELQGGEEVDRDYIRTLCGPDNEIEMQNNIQPKDRDSDSVIINDGDTNCLPSISSPVVLEPQRDEDAKPLQSSSLQRFEETSPQTQETSEFIEQNISKSDEYGSDKEKSEGFIGFLPSETDDTSLMLALRIQAELEKLEDIPQVNQSLIDAKSIQASVLGFVNSEGEVLDTVFTQKNAQNSKKIVKKKRKKMLSGAGLRLEIGTKVVAKDFKGFWHLARIIEIDNDENEMLIHYDDPQKQDEWLGIFSSRLRTYIPPGSKLKPKMFHEGTHFKTKAKYSVGEVCLAKWRYLKFPATITQILDDNKYEVVFYDGFKRICSWSALTKMKPGMMAEHAGPNDPQSLNSPLADSATPPAPSNEYMYSRHLFDPNIDHLISKKERRDMKRKLNVKELFNIDQGKKKNENLIKVKVSKPKKKQKAKIEVFECELSVDDDVPEAEEMKPEKEMKPVKKIKPAEEINLVEELKSEVEDVDVKCEISEFSMENQETANDEIPEIMSASVRQSEPAPGPQVKQEEEEDIKSSSRAESEDEMVKKIIEEIKKNVKKIEKHSPKKKSSKSKHAAVHPYGNKPESDIYPEVKLLANGLRVGEWCCRWLNEEPEGVVTELPAAEGTGLARKSVQVEDYRLPKGWVKHLVRRTHGSSAGKWDVVYTEPGGKRFRSKSEMSAYLLQLNDPALIPYEIYLMDFGVHRKISKQLGWDRIEPFASGSKDVVKAESDNISELEKSLAKEEPVPSLVTEEGPETKHAIVRIEKFLGDVQNTTQVPPIPVDDPFPHVYVGSLQVRIIENLLRCPAEGCFKNFRKDNLLRMHIQHYHKDLKKQLGTVAKVADLASIRATPACAVKGPKLKIEFESENPKMLKPKPIKSVASSHENKEKKSLTSELAAVSESFARKEVKPVQKKECRENLSAVDRVKAAIQRYKKLKALVKIPSKTQKRNLIINKLRKKLPFGLKKKILKTSSKKKKVFTMVGKKKNEPKVMERKVSVDDEDTKSIPEDILRKQIDFEEQIEVNEIKRSDIKINKRKQSVVQEHLPPDKRFRLEQWNEGQSWSGSADIIPQAHLPAPSNDIFDAETGEKIKIVKMKQEEIINCHCGFREEDGLMIQCEMCLCWQHGVCHNIEHKSQVPDKYVCSICTNPPRGRKSQKWRNEQAPLYNGELADFDRSENLRRLHELAGNLIATATALHTTKCQLHVAQKRDHPKLYLWAKEWDAEPSNNREKNDSVFSDQLNMNSNYMDISKLDFNAILDIDKENLPLKTDLIGLTSPAHSLELPISTTELERLAKSVQGPEPETAIEAGACKSRLLRHVQRTHVAVDARLDLIEAQIAELESQEQALEDDETAEYYPKTKQTIQMMFRDLGILEDLASAAQ